ncbi:acylneuraminate cytidylyltransferase family protein [Campylobacter lanienae]|uniref:acylneuraminate cytidylyltransferase family protein n=1 Tax=Campylobacter lanienae TaxID=75658 RepID=UPI0021C180E5|nr:acylneuraminate cytidylyltransferase family protein [Campylobacter lanienae]
MKKDIVAVIPVKEHSSRLNNKNILPFADTTLLEYKIKQLKQVKEISTILVSSDSIKMLEIAKSYDVDIDKRPIEYANETKPFGEFLQYITTIVNNTHLMWACCTSPLVSTDRYKEAIESYFYHLKNNTHDSLITVYKFQHYLLDKKGPLNFVRGLGHVNSQDLPSYDYFTNGIILSPVKSVKKWNYHYGPNPYRMYLTQIESIDIDTEFDYYCALTGYKLLSKYMGGVIVNNSFYAPLLVKTIKGAI